MFTAAANSERVKRYELEISNWFRLIVATRTGVVLERRWCRAAPPYVSVSLGQIAPRASGHAEWICRRDTPLMSEYPEGIKYLAPPELVRAYRRWALAETSP